MITGGVNSCRVMDWSDGADEFLTKPFHLTEVFALARAVEAKSPFTHGHSERVMRHCLLMAEAVGIGAHEREVLRKGALLHDIGKIRIPDAILNKPDRLTDEEFDAVRQHPIHGAHIVEPLPSMREAIPLIRWHHERLDGSGYPDRLRGDSIPLVVCILSICDIYDSLASDRPYRRGMPPCKCLDILQDEVRGGGLDKEVLELFCRLMRFPHEEGAAPGGVLKLPPHDGA
jgi:putative nucleotidyltransferase with HDIG domain